MQNNFPTSSSFLQKKKAQKLSIIHFGRKKQQQNQAFLVATIWLQKQLRTPERTDLFCNDDKLNHYSINTLYCKKRSLGFIKRCNFAQLLTDFFSPVSFIIVKCLHRCPKTTSNVHACHSYQFNCTDEKAILILFFCFFIPSKLISGYATASTTYDMLLNPF